MINDVKMKTRPWKSGVITPEDAKRPKCRVLISHDGVKGIPDEDETDLVDWLIVIAYETKQE